jgi:hypothetical protein
MGAGGSAGGGGSKVMSADRKTPGESKEIVDVMALHPLEMLVEDRAVYLVDEPGLYAIAKTDEKTVTLASFGDSRAVSQLDQTAEYVVWTGPDGLSKVRK